MEYGIMATGGGAPQTLYRGCQCYSCPIFWHFQQVKHVLHSCSGG